MSTIALFLFIVAVVTVIGIITEHIKENRDVQGNNYRKMKQQLIKLLREDWYTCKMVEDDVLIHYQDEVFRVRFSISHLGKRYARVTVIDEYAVEGIGDVHPFVMDALVGRVTCNNIDFSNIALEDRCVCLFSTDIKQIKPFYRSLPRILDNLIATEMLVKKEFIEWHSEFGSPEPTEEKNYIGFRRASDEASEGVQQVAAETNMKSK